MPSQGPWTQPSEVGRVNLETSMQDSSIPTTSCHEALHKSPVCSRLTSLSSDVAGEDNGPAPELRFTQLRPIVLCKEQMVLQF